MVVQWCGQWIFGQDGGGSNFNMRMWLEVEDIAPAKKTKIISCTFSSATHKSSLLTRMIINCMFEMMVYSGLTRLLALWLARGGGSWARGKNLHKTGEQLRRYYRSICAAGRGGSANAFVETSSMSSTWPSRTILRDTVCIGNGHPQEAASYL